MKNLKLFLFNSLLITTLILFHTSLIYKVNYRSFSKLNVVNKITYLTSDELEGRLAGNTGNFLAQNYIVNDFKQNKIIPYKFKYLHGFTTYCPVETKGEPELMVRDSKGNLIASYKYNRDFKEAFLNLKLNNISFNNQTTVNIYPSAFIVKNSDNTSALFISSPMDSFSFRSSFIYDSPNDLYTMLSPKAFDEIVNYYKKGFTISCSFPYEVKNVEINNVAGVIKGKNPLLPPLVLTAHYDHLGKDLDGNIYRGALDNASGTSFLLELSSHLSSLPVPDRDIIIVALNAEEFGLLGAENFAKENVDRLKNSKVINFDMIGSDHNVPLTLMTGQDPEDKKLLLENLNRCCNDKKITHLIEARDSSDHAGFLNEGIDSVTINDGDISKIHTIEDKVEYISQSAIDRALDVVWPEIFDSAYKSSGLFLLDNRITILIFFICILSVALIYTEKK